MLKVNAPRLLDLMLQNKLGVQEVSRLCGISISSLSSILSGKQKKASIPTVARLADYFGVSPHELILENETKE